MSVDPGIVERSQKRELLVPIACMTFGKLLLLILLAAFLIVCFDRTASNREQHMVQQGFLRQLEQYEEILVPQADWDKAIEKLDHRFDRNFADVNFGNQLYTFNGFTRTFFVDGDGGIMYTSVNGKHAESPAFEPFRGISEILLRSIRVAEARRPPIRPDTHGGGPVTRPIQASGLVRVGNTVYIVIATLIQPDLGHVLPKGPRAPVAITALPIDDALLRTFAARYLVDDLEVVSPSARPSGKAYFPLLSPTGQEIGALAWTPRQPGITLFEQLKFPLLAGLALLGLAGWLLTRRSGAVVDKLIQSEKRAIHLAYHDQLTQVPNRAMLFECLPAMLSSIGEKTPLIAVQCIDLDRFKEVNDTLGHEAGDHLLKAVAERLRVATAICENALIARLGGDEFVLACPVENREAAEALAYACLKSLTQPIDCAYGQIDVGCSIGVALIDNARADPSAVLRQGDMALYQAKGEGRGRVEFFEPSMDEAFRTRRALEERMRASLRQDAFHMVYQPQVDLRGEVRSVEALLRWKHPDLGEISPSVFIPLAEESGLITAIGEFVLRRVFEETANWHRVRVAINVSAIQMRAPGFAAQVMQLASRAGVDPARYEIELTETALLGDGQAITENFEVLRRMGFSIVLDDFGTGYSSLSLLHRFRVDKIKIDRSFVSGLNRSSEINALVGAIVKLAKSFRLGVIAEGVETEEQRRQLTRCGCTEFQGFLTGKPMSGKEFSARYAPLDDVRRLA